MHEGSSSITSRRAGIATVAVHGTSKQAIMHHEADGNIRRVAVAAAAREALEHEQQNELLASSEAISVIIKL